MATARSNRINAIHKLTILALMLITSLAFTSVSLAGERIAHVEPEQICMELGVCGQPISSKYTTYRETLTSSHVQQMYSFYAESGTEVTVTVKNEEVPNDCVFNSHGTFVCAIIRITPYCSPKNYHVGELETPPGHVGPGEEGGMEFHIETAGTYCLLVYWELSNVEEGNTTASAPYTIEVKGTPPLSIGPPEPPKPPSCVVPRLPHNSKLVVAEKLIAASHCAVGHIVHAHSKTVRKGRVIETRPGPGKKLANNAAVTIVVSSGKPKR